LASPVRLVTAGGDELVVHLEISGDRVRDVLLQGDAVYVYDGAYLDE